MIYFIQESKRETNYVKIGYAEDVEQRLAREALGEEAPTRR